MNKLTHHIQANKLDHDEAMNALTEAGIISDNCVTSEDVADADIPKAIQFLKQQH